MADVRVDECLLNDPRFKLVVDAIWDRFHRGEGVLSQGEAEDLALALCTRVFWVAQRYWREDRKPIPLKIWGHGRDFNLLLDAELAERRADGVYVRGSEKFFDWYHSKSAAGKAGGIASGEARRKQRSSASEADEAETPEATKQRPLKHEAVSVSVSVSDSVSKSNSTPKSADPLDEGLAREWFAYASAHSKTVRFSAKWPDAIRQLRELDKVSLEDLRSALSFVQKDEFWKSNALSLPALRTRSKNGLLKIENILAKMRDQKQAQPQGLPYKLMTPEEVANVYR